MFIYIKYAYVDRRGFSLFYGNNCFLLLLLLLLFSSFAFSVGDLAKHDWCNIIDFKQPYKVTYKC